MLVTLIVYPAMRDWRAQPTYVSPAELNELTTAGRIAATTPPGTPLVFVADDPAGIDYALFHLSHGLNTVRAAIPPDRAGDVSIFLGRAEDLLAGRPTVRGDPVFDRASADSLAQIPPGPRAIFVAPELDRDPIRDDDARSHDVGRDGRDERPRDRIAPCRSRRALPVRPVDDRALDDPNVPLADRDRRGVGVVGVRRILA